MHLVLTDTSGFPHRERVPPQKSINYKNRRTKTEDTLITKTEGNGLCNLQGKKPGFALRAEALSTSLNQRFRHRIRSDPKCFKYKFLSCGCRSLK